MNDKRVFLSAESNSQYDDIYLAFLDVFAQAAQGGVTFTPWLVLSSSQEEALCAATIVQTGHLAGLYNLATSPECRGKGFSIKVMQEAFIRARGDGARNLFLITETESKLEQTYAGLG